MRQYRFRPSTGMLACVSVLLLLFRVPVASATCGDGILDAHFELCDHGAANGVDGCCTSDCGFVDADADGLCDAAEPCADPGLVLADATLSVAGFATPAGDDTFRLTGTLTPTAPVDPATDGISFAAWSRFLGPFVDARIPGGTHWASGPRGGWVYRDRQGTIEGITHVSIKPVASAPETLAILIEGRRSDYAVSWNIRPIRAAVALTASEAAPERCGQTFLPVALCSFNPSRRTLRCRRLPPQQPCVSTNVDAQVRCETLNVAAAQEAYYTTHAEYFSGACTDLPGFTSAGGVACVTVGDIISYTVFAGSPNGIGTCVYVSLPAEGQSNLVCG
jgi:hypothetical protein